MTRELSPSQARADDTSRALFDTFIHQEPSIADISLSMSSVVLDTGMSIRNDITKLDENPICTDRTVDQRPRKQSSTFVYLEPSFGPPDDEPLKPEDDASRALNLSRTVEAHTSTSERSLSRKTENGSSLKCKHRDEVSKVNAKKGMLSGMVSASMFADGSPANYEPSLVGEFSGPGVARRAQVGSQEGDVFSQSKLSFDDLHQPFPVNTGGEIGTFSFADIMNQVRGLNDELDASRIAQEIDLDQHERDETRVVDSKSRGVRHRLSPHEASKQNCEAQEAILAALNKSLLTYVEAYDKMHTVSNSRTATGELESFVRLLEEVDTKVDKALTNISRYRKQPYKTTQWQNRPAGYFLDLPLSYYQWIRLTARKASTPNNRRPGMQDTREPDGARQSWTKLHNATLRIYLGAANEPVPPNMFTRRKEEFAQHVVNDRGVCVEFWRGKGGCLDLFLEREFF